MMSASHWRRLLGVLIIHITAVSLAHAAKEGPGHHTIATAAPPPTVATTAAAVAAAAESTLQQHNEQNPQSNTAGTADQKGEPVNCEPSPSTQQLQQSTTSEKLAAVRELTRWLLANHAEVNVEAREGEPGAGFALFALRDVGQGEVLLSLPTDLGFRRTSDMGVMGFLLDYVLDVFNMNSPRARMWATAPRPHELRHLLNFPKQYLPLLQNKQLEDWISHGLHQDLQLFYKLHYDILATAGISYDNLVHAMGLVGTRIFNKPADSEDGPTTFYALPLLDMANHKNNCPHSNIFGPCRFDSNRECVYFTAGADLAAGDEVCFYYGYLLPDRALLEYGFLPQQETDIWNKQSLLDGPAVTPAATQEALDLSGIDRHDADMNSHPLRRLYFEPAEFVGETSAQTTVRIHALQLLLEQLRSGDRNAEQIKGQGPAEGDHDGCFLSHLLSWRIQRQQAIAAEIGRLQSQL